MANSEKQQRHAAELAEQAALADFSELTAPVLHEINNFLNTLLLQIALMEQQGPASQRWCGEIRQQAKNVTAIVRQLQQARPRQRSAVHRVDVNRVLHVTVARLQQEHANPGRSIEVMLPGAAAANQAGGQVIRVFLELAPELPPLPYSALVLQRLCRFLLTNALQAFGPASGDVSVRSALGAGKILLSFEDTGPAVDENLLVHFFDPMYACREGTSRLELAACKTLMRRLGGKIDIANRPDTGVVISVELPLLEC